MTIFRQRGIDRSQFPRKGEFTMLVKDKIREALAKFPMLTMVEDDVTIVYIKTGGSAGHCQARKVNGRTHYNLEFNTHAIAQDWDDMVNDTIAHEVAHMIDYAIHGKMHGHSRVWKRIAWSIGCTGNRCHTLDMSAVKRKRKKLDRFIYEATCGTEVQLTKIRHNRLQSGQVSSYSVIRTGGKIDASGYRGRADF